MPVVACMDGITMGMCGVLFCLHLRDAKSLMYKPMIHMSNQKIPPRYDCHMQMIQCYPSQKCVLPMQEMAIGPQVFYFDRKFSCTLNQISRSSC